MNINYEQEQIKFTSGTDIKKIKNVLMTKIYHVE